MYLSFLFRRDRKLVFLFVLLALGATRCAWLSPSATPELSGRLLLGGSGAAYPALQVLTTEFVERHPHVTIVYETSSQTSAAAKYVAEGRLDIGLIGRPLNEQENHPFLKEIPIARDAVILAVHPSVGVKNLTTIQAQEIFKGAIQSWSQVGGAEHAIVVLDRVEGETAKIALRRHVLGANLEITPNAIVMPTEKDMFTATAMVPDSIGFFSLTYAVQNPKKVNAIALDGVMPSFETVRAGAYRVVRPISIVVNPERMNASPLREFLAFLDSSDARALLAQAGLMPEVEP
jgi:phosphate transport system substrate-binding protein